MWDFLKGVISGVIGTLEKISTPLLLMFFVIHLCLSAVFMLKSEVFLSAWFGFFYIFTITIFSYEVLPDEHQRED